MYTSFTEIFSVIIVCSTNPDVICCSLQVSADVAHRTGTAFPTMVGSMRVWVTAGGDECPVDEDPADRGRVKYIFFTKRNQRGW